jgi:hypothetical protein
MRVGGLRSKSAHCSVNNSPHQIDRLLHDGLPLVLVIFFFFFLVLILFPLDFLFFLIVEKIDFLLIPFDGYHFLGLLKCQTARFGIEFDSIRRAVARFEKDAVFIPTSNARHERVPPETIQE